MNVKTKIINGTKERQHYQWIPKHGLTMKPGEVLEVNGPLTAKNKRSIRIMNRDIASGRVTIVTDNTVEFNKPEGVKVDAVEKKKAVKEDKKEPVVVVNNEGDMLADQNITIPKSEDVEVTLPGVTIVDEDEKEPVFDERGVELPEEAPPIVVTNIHDINEDDILAKVAEESKAAKPTEEDLNAMDIKEVKGLAKEMGVKFKKNASKKAVIELILAV